MIIIIQTLLKNLTLRWIINTLMVKEFNNKITTYQGPIHNGDQLNPNS